MKEEQQTDKLLISWGALSRDGKRRLLEYASVMVEMERPSYQEQRKTQDEIYRQKMVKARDMKAELEQVANNLRNAIASLLPKKNAGLLSDLELLTYLVFLAEYDPFAFDNKNLTVFGIAKRLLVTVPRKMKNLEARAQ